MMLDFGFYNMDCMDGMKEFPDKFFDLAIVDPPYGIGMDKNPCGRLSVYGSVAQADNNPPNKEYFDELFRVSKNQIIWGGNYFDLPPTRCFVIWDKKQPQGVSFAMCEYAWTSFNTSAKTFYLSPMNADIDRIHPTQKPIALYTWLLQNYAKQGDKILDTHVGSASSLIACHRMGFQYWGFELYLYYHKTATDRIAREQSMQPLFAPQEIYKQVGLEI